MKIKRITLHGYKRFTDLTVANLPETARLVVLLGPNGCGKSSLLDAILASVGNYHGADRHGVVGYDPEYHCKAQSEDSKQHGFNIDNLVKVEFDKKPAYTDREAWEKAVYLRSAHRNDPRAISDTPKIVSTMIETDLAVGGNYHSLAGRLFDLVGKKEGYKAYCEIMEKIRQPMLQLFDNPPLMLNDFGNPQLTRTFRFTKGSATGYKFENLSSGEKAAFDLVLDMVVKGEKYNDTVFCIDEPEAHIGFRLQTKLLEVLYDLVPNSKCQLWIATHSIGMMRKAWELQKKFGEDNVVFLDFDGKDFDAAELIQPAKINGDFWRKMHRITLEDMAELVVPTTIILCEGEYGRRVNDAKCYNTIFSKYHPDVLFIAGGGKGDLPNLAPAIRAITQKATILILRDRDGATDNKIIETANTGIRILRNGSIEDYLMADDILRAFCKKQRCPDSTGILINARKQAETTKAAGQKVFQEAKKISPKNNCGENKDDFLQNVLAPLIAPGMTTYEKLDKEIFGEIDS